MQHVILVVSPDLELIQQVHSHLEEGGRFRVTGANNAQDALNLANGNFYEVAILDSDLTDIPVAAFSRDLSALQADIKILVYPPGNDPHDPSLEGLVTNGFLNKPFSSPDISNALSRLFSDQPVNNPGQVEALDDLIKQWLEIPENGEQKAKQILANTTAQATIIMIKGEEAAKSGELDEKLLEKVEEFLKRYWREDENSELARFININGAGSEKFVYATKLLCNVVLVLVYAHTVPLQQVRRELIKVKDDFQKNYPTTGELRQEIANKTLAKVHEQSKSLESLQPFTGAISQSELDALKAIRESSQPSSTIATIPKSSDSPSISQDEMDELNKLLAAMPAPDPKPEAEQSDGSAPDQADDGNTTPDWLQELQKAGVAVPDENSATTNPVQVVENPTPVAPPFVEEENKNESIIEPQAGQEGPEQTAEAPQPSFGTEPQIEQTEQRSENYLDETQPSATAEPLPEVDFKLPWESEEMPDEPMSVQENGSGPSQTIAPPLVDDDNSSFTELLEEAMTEPAAPISAKDGMAALSEEPTDENTPPELKDFRFSYTCVLIPNDRSQFLARELSEKISSSLPQFHLAQGWQLTNMTIRPQYLLWTVAVPINVCPHQIIHDIRSLTSAHIFANFPEIAKAKTSEDFWSSQYMAVSGTELPPGNLITDFVSQVWNAQETSTT